MSPTSPAGLFRNFRLFLDIALFRRGPEDLPVSPTLLLVTIVLSVLLALLPAAFAPKTPDDLIAMTVTASALEVAWYWALLRLAGRPERFLQTSTAIFGVQVVILVLAFFVLSAASVTQDAAGALPALALFATIALRIWLLVLEVRIVQAATEWAVGRAVMTVLAQAFIAFLVLYALFPDALRRAIGAAPST